MSDKSNIHAAFVALKEFPMETTKTGPDAQNRIGSFLAELTLECKQISQSGGISGSDINIPAINHYIGNLSRKINSEGYSADVARSLSALKKTFNDGFPDKYLILVHPQSARMIKIEKMFVELYSFLAN